MNTIKPFTISKRLVWQAYQSVKAKGGTAGIDEESIQGFERDLENNLYRLWNRLSSGTYFPPAVKGVEIPKKAGGKRLLGVPTVSDRIAQTVVKIVLEPQLDCLFDADSYGYRPKKSAHDAIAVTRKRCWEHDWVVEFDIKGLFDTLDHDLLIKALTHHCDCKWILLYVKRWLKAPLQREDGTMEERTRGTPQGGVISPLLANLFMHYAFDAWMRRTFPKIPFCRYADDGLMHCRTYRQAKYVLECLEKRFKECGLELHPEKSKIIYCKDKNRKESYETISFDFLGYTFRPRRCVNGKGVIHPNFLPAVSQIAKKAIHREIRSWHLQLKNDKELDELAKMINPTVRGWWQYYGRFYPSAMQHFLRHIDWYLAQWVRRKYKKFAGHKRRARQYIARIAQAKPSIFVHWSLKYQMV